jgi:hypothetical protein
MSAGIQNGVPAEGTGVAAEKPDPAGSSKSKLQPLAVGIKGRSAMSGIGAQQRSASAQLTAGIGGAADLREFAATRFD